MFGLEADGKEHPCKPRPYYIPDMRPIRKAAPGNIPMEAPPVAPARTEPDDGREWIASPIEGATRPKAPPARVASACNEPDDGMEWAGGGASAASAALHPSAVDALRDIDSYEWVEGRMEPDAIVHPRDESLAWDGDGWSPLDGPAWSAVGAVARAVEEERNVDAEGHASVLDEISCEPTQAAAAGVSDDRQQTPSSRCPDEFCLPCYLAGDRYWGEVWNGTYLIVGGEAAAASASVFPGASAASAGEDAPEKKAS